MSEGPPPREPFRPRQPIDLPGHTSPPSQMPHGGQSSPARQPAPDPRPAGQAPQAQQAVAPAKQPPGPPPGLGEIMELSFRAFLTPATVFQRFGRALTPGIAELLLNYLFWSASGILMALLVISSKLPANTPFGPLQIGIGFVVGTVAFIPLGFIAAGLMHLLAKISGGERDFARSYQIISILSAVGPLLAAILYASKPILWILPTLYLTFLAVTAIEHLHEAPAAQAWMFVGALGAAAAGLQFKNADAVARIQYRFEDLATVYSVNDEQKPDVLQSPQSSTSLDAPAQAANSAAASRSAYDGVGAGLAQGSALGAAPAKPAAAPAGSSSLDLLRQKNRGIETDQTYTRRDMEAYRAQSSVYGERRAAGAAFISQAREQLASNPAILKNLTPDQRKRLLGTLNAMENQVQKGGSGGAPVLNDPKTQESLLKLLRDVGNTAPQPHKAGASTRRKRR